MGTLTLRDSRTPSFGNRDVCAGVWTERSLSIEIVDRTCPQKGKIESRIPNPESRIPNPEFISSASLSTTIRQPQFGLRHQVVDILALCVSLPLLRPGVLVQTECG